MRLAVGHAVAGPVPAIHGAVVHLERRQLWDLAAPQPPVRVLPVGGAEKGRDPGDVLVEHLEHRLLHPALAEPHARRELAQVRRGAAGVDRLLKQGDARLGPQPPPEQERRVDGGREHRRREDLGDVVQPRHLLGTGLQMHLEARVAPLEHYGVVLEVKLVRPLDVQPVGAARHAVRRLVEHVVALERGEVLQSQVRHREAGQDAGEHDLRVVGSRLFAHGANQCVHFFLQMAEAARAQRHGRQVDLEVVKGDLGRELGSGEPVEHLHGDGSRPPPPVDQKQLLLGPYPTDPRLEHALLEHGTERAQVQEKRLRVQAHVIRIEAGVYLQSAHGLLRTHEYARQAGRCLSGETPRSVWGISAPGRLDRNLWPGRGKPGSIPRGRARNLDRSNGSR